MQLYTEWNKYKLRKLSCSNHDETFKGTIKKTGIFTLVVILLAFVNMILNILFPNKSNNQEYFLSQDLISIFLTSIILPMIITATNPGLSKYLKQYIISICENVAKFLISWQEIIGTLVAKRNNQIQPFE